MTIVEAYVVSALGVGVVGFVIALVGVCYLLFSAPPLSSVPPVKPGDSHD